MFHKIEGEMNQFGWLAVICIILGCFAALNFVWSIKEPKLIEDSKKVYDLFFDIEPQQVDSDGINFEFEPNVNPFVHQETIHSRKMSEGSNKECPHFPVNDDLSVSDFFAQARNKVRAVSEYGKYEFKRQNPRPRQFTEVILIKGIAEPKKVEYLQGDVDSVEDLDKYYESNVKGPNKKNIKFSDEDSENNKITKTKNNKMAKTTNINKNIEVQSDLIHNQKRRLQRQNNIKNEDLSGTDSFISSILNIKSYN